VLVEDGTVVHAIEQERLNRIKHTSKGPGEAVRRCLAARGVGVSSLDQVVYYGSEPFCESAMRDLFYSSCEAAPVRTYRQLIHEFFAECVGEPLPDKKLAFIHHHLAHAISAFAQSGFEESLVVTIDGAGDGLSGSVSRFSGEKHQVLATIPAASSLGIFYDRVIAMLGFGFTEEFKVMGLAPYGDPQRFAAEFKQLYELQPGGAFAINWPLLTSLHSLAPVRKRDEPILQVHMDIAAALQNALETIVFNLLGHFRQVTGMTSLCLAGGVAHNSTMNGKLLYSQMFSDIFVQPAAGDSGCALGAALAPSLTVRRDPIRIEHVFWGTDLGSSAAVAERLEAWHPLIEIQEERDLAARCAQLMADGEVIGWAQGRSEFGPRALGHRSILADPRPAENKDLVNAMVKKRESFRPFAPAVLEEYFDEYFEAPRRGMKFPFMSFTVRVRPEHRDKLRAITHVDGTARVQTVSRNTDPDFWAVIEAFRRVTGVPILLNTSFNNNAEPIVDTVDDAVACFLTTGLHRLAVGNFLISKRKEEPATILRFSASLPSHAQLIETNAPGPEGRLVPKYSITNGYDNRRQVLSHEAYKALKSAPPGRALSNGSGLSASDAFVHELWELWRNRMIAVRPELNVGPP
jgi:carbamoyltransferase